MLDLSYCAQAFSSCREPGRYSLVAVLGLHAAVASPGEEHGLQGAQASIVAACGPSSCSSRALQRGLSRCGAWA